VPPWACTTPPLKCSKTATALPLHQNCHPNHHVTFSVPSLPFLSPALDLHLDQTSKASPRNLHRHENASCTPPTHQHAPPRIFQHLNIATQTTRAPLAPPPRLHPFLASHRASAVGCACYNVTFESRLSIASHVSQPNDMLLPHEPPTATIVSRLQRHHKPSNDLLHHVFTNNPT